MISLKICPLCNSPLAVRNPEPHNYTTPKMYICGTHVPEHGKLSHYYIEVTGSHYIQIVQLPPYVIINDSNKDTSDVYPFNTHINHITNQKQVITIPRIPLTTADKLTERLKILVLFS